MINLSNYSVIQGGMGVKISGPHLAKAVSCLGGIGTVSLTAAPHILADALQKGDMDHSFQLALCHFPSQGMANRVFSKYYVKGGLRQGQKGKPVPMFSLESSRDLIELTFCASFALVWLAKHEHCNPIFINLLEKIQIPHIYSIFGAMCAGVDGVVMGAGLPRQIPSVIEAILDWREVSYEVTVKGASEKKYVKFDPQNFFGPMRIPMQRPAFLPIVSSNTLVKYFCKPEWKERVQGLIIELPTAGGHNAPPRGEHRFDEKGNLLYDMSGKDKVNFEEVKTLGVPFFIGGSYASPEKIAEAKALGACGVQVGSLFALCDESGIVPGYKREIISHILAGTLQITTSATASPTGFPFKVVELDGSVSDGDVYNSRKRICDMGYLRELCDVGGKIVYRCPAEPEADFERKGGSIEDTVGRKCICNGLSAGVGMGSGYEPSIFTLGDCTDEILLLAHPGTLSYAAGDVMRYLLGK